MTTFFTNRDAGDAFDAAQGLYWYCADYHNGQWSEEYRVLSTLGYKPSMSEHGPDPDSYADEVYRALVSGDTTVSETETFVHQRESL